MLNPQSLDRQKSIGYSKSSMSFLFAFVQFILSTVQALHSSKQTEMIKKHTLISEYELIVVYTKTKTRNTQLKKIGNSASSPICVFTFQQILRYVFVFHQTSLY